MFNLYIKINQKNKVLSAILAGLFLFSYLSLVSATSLPPPTIQTEMVDTPTSEGFVKNLKIHLQLLFH